jgi:hypothetical protein
MEAKDQSFANASEVLDGNQYENCTFDNCQLLYRGGEIPRVVGCTFNNCQWRFEDAAERTLVFMRQLYHGMGPGGKQLMEATLNIIRQSP